jgi:hypothetical protein
MVSVVGKFEYGDCYRVAGKGVVWTGWPVDHVWIKPGDFLVVHSNLVRVVGVEKYAISLHTELIGGKPCGLLLEPWFDTERDWPKTHTMFTVLRDKQPGEK